VIFVIFTTWFRYGKKGQYFRPVGQQMTVGVLLKDFYHQFCWGHLTHVMGIQWMLAFHWMIASNIGGTCDGCIQYWIDTAENCEHLGWPMIFPEIG
jgi:hypothetical protein